MIGVEKLEKPRILSKALRSVQKMKDVTNEKRKRETDETFLLYVVNTCSKRVFFSMSLQQKH